MTDDPIQPEAEELEADHPHAGVPAEGFSAPDASDASSRCGEIVLKRGGAETDVRFSISPPAVIGRFDPALGPIDVDLAPVPEGSYVSRRHATICYEDGAWKLKDLGSSNGSFVLRDDFERVEEAELKSGDEFALGNARFIFRDLTQDEPA